jgi:hypothetical protein
MKFPIKSAGIGLIALAAIGCASEEDTPPPTDAPVAVPGKVSPTGPGAGPSQSQSAAPTAAAPSEAPKSGDEKAEAAPTVEGPKGETPKADAASGGFSAEQLANIKQLSPEDQKLAMAQKVCPVSNDRLGEMGKPFKIAAEGRTFFLCCDGCEKDVKADPKGVIAKLDKK